MADVIDFKSKTKVGPEGPDPAPRPPEHEYTFGFFEGEKSVSETGWLSFGPMFVAVVDENDFVKLVIPAGSFKYIKKGDEVVSPQSE